ncbi:MAG: hypothetical protein GC181_02945 [Bacteroidetes bacterium]|nr:hypothetical protein [Bacteroidota bacterium]
MVLMALDHTRDMVHDTANTINPLDLELTTIPLFFTRWITHFCAPIFIFLSGTSIYLQSLRKTPKELGGFLIKRGLWLILIEWTLVGFAWSFNPKLGFLPLQVIWAIGISMVLLGIFLLLKIPFKALLAFGFVIVAGHNLLDFHQASENFKPNFWWDLFHTASFSFYPITDQLAFLIIYPFPAWTGVMILGYCFGYFYSKDFSPEIRKKWLTRIGLALIGFFLILRFINVYGDPNPWTSQDTFLKTILSFIKVEKYPPSLIYLCMTMGPSILVLAWIENIRNWFTDKLTIFGRTAFMYYILHLYLIHIVAMILFFYRGHDLAFAIKLAQQIPFYFIVPGEGFPLAGVYVVWILVVVALYPICNWYNSYKSANRDKWWLAYL